MRHERAFHETLPEEFRESERAEEIDDAPADEPDAAEVPVQTVREGNAWLLVGIFALITIGVLVLLIFASGGDSNSSML